MAIAVDQSAHQNVNGSNTCTVNMTTSGSGRFLLLTSHVSNSASTVSSITDAAATWVKILEIQEVATTGGWVSVWRTLASGTYSGGSITVNYAGGFPQASVVVTAYTGTDTTGTNGSGAVGASNSATAGGTAPSVNVTTTRANSLVVAGVGQDSGITWSAGSGQTINDQTLSAGGFSTLAQFRQNSVTANSGTAVTMNATSSSSASEAIIGVEILAPVSTVIGYQHQTNQPPQHHRKTILIGY